MKPFHLSAMAAIAAFPLVAACGVAGNHGGQSMAQITATIEASGFTCEVRERHPDKFVQVADCRSNQDKYQKLIASEWKDPTARDEMYQNKIPGMCGTLGMKDQVRWSTAGNWALVAGGSGGKDVKALDEATSALGFEPHATPCQ